MPNGDVWAAYAAWLSSEVNEGPGGKCWTCQKVNKLPGQKLGRFLVTGSSVTGQAQVLTTDHADRVDLGDPDTQQDISRYIRDAVFADESFGSSYLRSIFCDKDGIIPSEWQIQSRKIEKDEHFVVDAVPGIVYDYIPDKVAVEISKITDEAVKWFHPKDFPDFEFDAVITKRPILDDEVALRVQGFQFAMDREISRITGFCYGGDDDFACWRWGYGSEWRNRHREWVAAFNEWAITTEGQRKLDDHKCYRYDLSRLPWSIQRALVTRWEKVWESLDGKYHPRLGFTIVPIDLLDIVEVETAPSKSDVSLIVRFLVVKEAS